MPDLVGPEDRHRAIALNQTIFNGSRLIGPALGAIAIAVFGFAGAYIANGLSYLAVIYSLVVLRLPPGGSRGEVRGSAVSAMKEGIGHVWRSPLLRPLMGVSALTAFFLMPCLAVLAPAYVKFALHQGPKTSALLMAASGGASMFGSIGMMWIPAVRRGVTMLLCIVLAAFALATLASTHSVIVATMAMGMLSLGMTLVFGLNATTVQQVTPNAIRGRVMAVSGMMFSGVMPFASILLGASVQFSNVRATYASAGGAYLFVASYMLWRSGLIGHAPETLAEPALERQTAAVA